MARFDRLKVVVELAMRYMDDGRTLLHPFKAGWRWADGELVYCKRWEIEDRGQSIVSSGEDKEGPPWEDWRTF